MSHGNRLLWALMAMHGFPSLRALGRAADVSQGHISHIMRRRKALTGEVAGRLATVLHVDERAVGVLLGVPQ